VAEDDPEVAALVEKYRRTKRNVSGDEILRRLLLVMLQEATRVLDEGIACRVRDVDLGVLFALGFPAQTGGLLSWADSIGLDTILSWLEPFAPLGPRMQPTERLLRMARKGERFYPEAAATIV
jgi:3-hydroxyacyl-CoA dehydrogenase